MAGKNDLRITPVTIQAQTAGKLRHAILDGVFKPGEKLLEAELCRRMGVSRTSVREALRQLEAERLVTIIPNRGPSVTQLTWKEAEAIYDARELLEGESAARFAERATAAEIALAKAALADFDRAVTMDDAHGRLTHTQRFYELIIEGCGNAIIGEMLQSLFARINFLRARSMSREGRGRNSSIEMWKIYAAIESTTRAPHAPRPCNTSSRLALPRRRSSRKTASAAIPEAEAVSEKKLPAQPCADRHSSN